MANYIKYRTSTSAVASSIGCLSDVYNSSNTKLNVISNTYDSVNDIGTIIYDGTVHHISHDYGNPISYGGSHITHIFIPEGVVQNYDNAFAYGDELEEIWFPLSWQRHGYNTFEHSPNIKVLKYYCTAGPAYDGWLVSSNDSCVKSGNMYYPNDAYYNMWSSYINAFNNGYQQNYKTWTLSKHSESYADNPYPDVNLTPSKQTPTLSASINGTTYGDTTVFTLSTDSDGLITVKDTDTTTVLGTGYNGDTVSHNYAAGTHNYSLTVAETSAYSSGTTTGSIVVSKAVPTLAFTVSGTTQYGNTIYLKPTSNSDGLITFAEGQASIGTCYTGGYVEYTPSTAGNHTIEVSIASTANYLSASTSQSITIAKGDNTVTIALDPSNTYVKGTPVQFTVSATGTGAITAKWGDTVLTPTGNTYSYTPNTAGTYTITATQAEDTNYLSGSTTQSVTITRQARTISLEVIGNRYVNEDKEVHLTASEGTFNYYNPPHLSVKYGSGSYYDQGAFTITSGDTVGYKTWKPTSIGEYTLYTETPQTTDYLSAYTKQTVIITENGRIQPTTTISFSGGTTVGDTNLVSVETDSDGILTVYMNGSVFTDSAFTAYSATTYNFSAVTTQTSSYFAHTATATRTFGKAPNSVYLDIQGTLKEYDPMTITVSAITNTLIKVYADNTQIGSATHEGTFTYTHEGYGTVVFRADAEGDSNYNSGTTSQTVTIEHVKLDPTTTYTVTGEAKVGSERHIYASTTSDSDITVKWNGDTIGTIDNPNGTIDYTPTVAGYSTLSFHTEETFDYNSGVTEAQIWEDKGDSTLSIYLISSAHTGTDWTYTVSASTTNTDSDNIHYDAYRKNNNDWILYSSGDTTAGTTFTFTDQQAGNTYIGKLEVSQAETTNFNSASTYTMLTYNGDLSSMVTLGEYCRWDYSYDVLWPYFEETFWEIRWYYNVRVYETYNGFPYTINVQRKFRYGDGTESQWVNCNGYTFDAKNPVLMSESVWVTYQKFPLPDIQYVKLKFIFPEGTNFPYAEYETDWERVYYPIEDDLKLWTDKEELQPIYPNSDPTGEPSSAYTYIWTNTAYKWGETVQFNASSTTNPNPVKLHIVKDWLDEYDEDLTGGWINVENPLSSAVTLNFAERPNVPFYAYAISVAQDRFYDTTGYTWNERLINRNIRQYVRPQPAIPDLTITVLNEGKIHAGEYVDVLISTPSGGLPISATTYNENNKVVNNTTRYTG